MKTFLIHLLRLLLPSLFCLLLLIPSVRHLSSQHREENRRQLEDMCRFAAVSCYAAEGFYPPDLAYLEEHYSLTVDHSRYAVFYEIFAENLMPDITVVELYE